MKNSVTLTACGKLNLFLDIVGKRDDGYHLLETVMQSVSVKDRLSFSLEKGTGVELRCDVPGIPTDGSNLIIKAVDRFCEKTGAKPDGRLIIDLKKNIPSMAGMGGGSADCAAALAAMNELSAAGLSMTELLDMAQTLGADVPFTLMGGTALCEGIGEMMTPIRSPGDVFYVAVQPELRISTAEAYKACDTAPPKAPRKCSEFIEALEAGNIRLAAGRMYNVFEKALALPEIEDIKSRLGGLGALGAMLTGSGSVVFGVFDDPDKAQNCAQSLTDFGFAQVLVPQLQGIEIIDSK